MSPRGVLNRSVRERLLGAAAHLLQTGGQDAVTVRAIAQEAGVATGLLYNYFSDRDDLLLAVVLERFRTQAGQAQNLLELAGSGTVEANLAAHGRTTVGGDALSLARAMLSRPELAARVRLALDTEHHPGFDAIEHAVADYLRAEQSLGRLAPDADPATAAVLLVSAWHQLLLRGHQDDDIAAVHEHVDRLVATLMRGLNPTGLQRR